MSRPTRNALETYGERIHIYARGDRYRIAWVDNLGQPRERSRRTLDDARDVAQRQAELLGMPHGASQPDALFGVLVADWLEPGRHPQWSDRTRDTHVTDMRSLVVPKLGGRTCSELKGIDCANLLNELARAGYSRETIRRVLRDLRSIVKHGRAIGTWPSGIDPLIGIGMPSRVEGRDPNELLHPSDIPSRREVDALAVAMDDIHPRLGLMIRVARDTGLRYAELLGVRPMDIDLRNREIDVKRTLIQPKSGPIFEGPPKTRAGFRKVIFSKELVAPLRTRMVEVESLDGLMFGTLVTCQPWRRSNWAKTMKLAREASGYPEKFGLHSVRHHAITAWLDAGLPIGAVSRLAGHSSPEVTLRRYVGAGEDHLDQARAVL
jgi:integrase